MPEMMATMQDMAKEMEHMGLIQEMADDALSVIEPDDLDDEDEEVQAAVAGIFAELLPQEAAPAKVVATPAAAEPASPIPDFSGLDVPTTLPAVPGAVAGAAEPELSPADQDLMARLAGLTAN